MKTAILFSALAFCFMLVTAEAASPPNCSRGCNLKYCPELPECKCGTYKDYCNCCSFCLKCPGDQCRPYAMDRCADGTACKPPPGADAIARFNGPAWCT